MVEDRVERRLAAIFTADVVGYSRLVRADEEDTLAAVGALISARMRHATGKANGGNPLARRKRDHAWPTQN
jgi:adenylate cyclase